MNPSESRFPKIRDAMKRGVSMVALGFLLTQTPNAPAQDPTWAQVQPMPTARQKIATCVIGDHVYVIGGTTAANQPGLDDNERYNTATDRWTIRQAMPTPRRELVTAVVNGRCYAIGGRETLGLPTSRANEEYDPATDQWRARALMPEPRYFAAGAAIDDVIYVAGGAEGAVNTVSDSLFAYDPASNNWTTLAPMPVVRAVHAATALNGKLYVAGGTENPLVNRLSRVDEYDPLANQWTRLADLPSDLAGLSLSAAGGEIYAMGGAAFAAPTNGVSVFDPTANTWMPGPAMNEPRMWPASAVVGNVIYIFGGSQDQAPPHPSTPGAERLEVASSPFVINAGLNDAWFNRDTAGQGFFIIVFPDIGIIFLAWFTYDTKRPDGSVTAILGEPGHRWITAQGPFDGDTATLDVVLTAGGVFDAADPAAANVDVNYGTITITWADCEAALLSYTIPSLGLAGEIPITRIANDNVALCESLKGE